jgi:hypothetical protein
MAIPAQYGIPFTLAERTTIQTALQTILPILQSKVNFNMTAEERGNLSKIGDERLPYAMKSIKEYAVQYPNLNGQAYPVAMANIDFDTYGYMFTFLTTIAQMKELSEEIQMVAGHFCYRFMRDQYGLAGSYLGDNVPGAQVVYDGLKDCFEGQGPQNPATPPQP